MPTGPDAVRRAVLDAAAVLFAERGVGEVALRDIAAEARVNLALIQSKRLQVRGTGLRSRPHEERAAAVQAFAKSVLPHIGSGRMKVVIDRVFPLSEGQAGHEYMETNANFGKIVVEP